MFDDLSAVVALFDEKNRERPESVASKAGLVFDDIFLVWSTNGEKGAKALAQSIDELLSMAKDRSNPEMKKLPIALREVLFSFANQMLQQKGAMNADENRAKAG